MKLLKRLLDIDNLSVSFLVAMTLFWFGPIEIYSANSAEMSFAFKEFWHIVLLEGLAVLLIIDLLLALTSAKYSAYIKVLIFGICICLYVQSMFLNGYMKSFFNNNITWDTGVKVSNLLVWAAVLIVAILLQLKFMHLRSYIAAGLSLVQLVALISILVTTDILSEDKVGYLNAEHMLELGDDQNVIVFILDYFDTALLNRGVIENPNLLNGLDGFVWYTDSVGTHSRTYPSIAYLLSGDICYFDRTPKEYIKEAYANGNIITDLYKNDIDIAYFGYDYYLADGVKKYLSNYQSVNLPIDSYRLCRYLLKMVLYRDAPYICKRRLEYDINEINTYVRKNSSHTTMDNNDIYEVGNDDWFGNQLDNSKLTVSKEYSRAFRFYHLYACHRDLSDPLRYGKQSLQIVNEYIHQLKQLNLYDSTTIIITADHGFSGGGQLDIPLPITISPIALVKQSYSKEDGISIDKTPVSQSDFYPTVLDGFSLDYSSVGIPYYDPDNANRDRYFYYTALETSEKGEYELREFKVEGNALDINSYNQTGNVWPIKYSMNNVQRRE